MDTGIGTGHGAAVLAGPIGERDLMNILLKVSDYAAAVLMGSGTVFLVSLLVDDRWNAVLGMAAGMVLGFLVMGAVYFIFMRVSNPFNFFAVGMPVTMITGMASGMSAPSGTLTLEVLYTGALLVAVLWQLGIDLTDARLSGDVPIEK